MHNAMILIAMLMLAVPVMADVHWESLHHSDMELLDAILATEITNVTVMCVNQDGSINIGIVFSSDWNATDYQFGQLGFCLGAVGAFTSETSWHSDQVYIIYQNGGWACSTYQSRVFANGVGSWSEYELNSWISRNLSFDYVN